MNNKYTIQKFIAGILLFVFALSITPKRLLHDCVAKHKDGKTVTYFQNGISGERLSTASFNCQCDDFVVESPFVQILTSVSVQDQACIHLFAESNYCFIFSTYYFSSVLRGPPAFV